MIQLLRDHAAFLLLATMLPLCCATGKADTQETELDAAGLSSLVLSSATLTPPFDASITSYTATVDNPGTSVTVTPTTCESGSSITVQGTEVASGGTSTTIPLAAMTTVTVVVTGPDGSTQKTYTVVIELKGWQLNSGNTGLAGVGIVPSSLPLYTGPAKPDAGTVITELRIDKTLDLSNGDVTIERCWIQPTSITRGLNVMVSYDNNNDPPTPAQSPVTIRDCDIDGSLLTDEQVCQSTAFSGAGTIERNHIFAMGTGLGILHTSGTVPVMMRGNYIHDLRAFGDPTTTGSHNDGATIRDYTCPIDVCPDGAVFRNNRIACDSGNDTGAFFIQTYSGDIDHVHVENNLLEGGGYRLILEIHSAGIYVYGRDMHAVNNRIAPWDWGPTYVETHGLVDYGWAEWSENYMSDETQPDNKGSIIDDPSP
jgi:hypothetical protein